MKKTPENIVKKLKKLENYCILREEDEYLVVGSKITIKEHVEIHTTFSKHVKDIDKNYWIFFILTFAEDCLKLDEFRKKELPIIIMAKHIADSNIDKLKEFLDKAVPKKI